MSVARPSLGDRSVGAATEVDLVSSSRENEANDDDRASDGPDIARARYFPSFFLRSAVPRGKQLAARAVSLFDYPARRETARALLPDETP